MQSASQHLDELEWTQWPSDQIATRGKAQWKELLGSHSGCQNDMTMGVVRLLNSLGLVTKMKSIRDHAASKDLGDEAVGEAEAVAGAV